MTKNTPPKRGPGRPPKVSKEDGTAIIKKIEEQTKHFSAKCADNLHTLFSVVYDIAVSGDKKLSVKDKLASAKYCIEAAEKFLINEEKKEGGGAKEPVEEKVDTPQISLVPLKSK